MKKVAMTVVGVLALEASANAGGTWYTDQTAWQNLVTNFRTAEYNVAALNDTSIEENGVTATASSGNLFTSSGYVRGGSSVAVTFTFSGNAFWGQFRSELPVSSANFYLNGSLTADKFLSTSNRYKSMGYISDSATAISVKVSPTSGTMHIGSFSFGQSTSSLGASVAPEPGTLALALTGGCALIGMYIRRRRMSN
jgi:hypothetical protein